MGNLQNYLEYYSVRVTLSKPITSYHCFLPSQGHSLLDVCDCVTKEPKTETSETEVPKELKPQKPSQEPSEDSCGRCT